MVVPTVALTPGAIVAGRYRIESQIGEGGFGAVYRAHDHDDGRAVALKVLLPEQHDAATAIARFEREAQMVKALDHPHVVRLLDYGQAAEGQPYMAFELLTGQGLDAAIVTGGKLPAARVGHIAEQTLKALMAAHASGVVHRDIKPANIFLCEFHGESDFVKLLDFGVAKAGPQSDQQQPALTGVGFAVGTPAFMAPEQVVGKQVTPATDVYALGLVMAEALCGEQVMQADNDAEIAIAQISSEAVPLPPEVLRSPLGGIVLRATQKDPSRRYASAGEMLEELKAALDPSMPSLAPGPGAAVSGHVSVMAPAAGAVPTGPTLQAPPNTPPGQNIHAPMPGASGAPAGPSDHGLAAPAGAQPVAPTAVAYPSPSGYPPPAYGAAPGPAYAGAPPRKQGPGAGVLVAVAMVALVALVGLGGGAWYLASQSTDDDTEEVDDDDDDDDRRRRGRRKKKRRAAVDDDDDAPSRPPGGLGPVPLSRFDLDHAARTLEADGWRVLGRTTRQSTGVKTHYLTLAKDGAAGSLVVFRCDTASIAAAVEKGMVGQAHVAVTRQGNDLASVTLVDSKGNTTPEMLLRLVIR